MLQNGSTITKPGLLKRINNEIILYPRGGRIGTRAVSTLKYNKICMETSKKCYTFFLLVYI